MPPELGRVKVAHCDQQEDSDPSHSGDGWQDVAFQFPRAYVLRNGEGGLQSRVEGA